ncbi:peptide/nickel transport system ATP-binding protein [Hydrogenophaga palleronii]|uniref:Peptide/nickel transport system ATP-binding protein n=1 Tax=Hydrogenophaga palleronii TaxID=65655 RepID=A0ABU1WRE6_9BURK|nr:ABC transporter ATP-binding protein [Hydrogenophaga palleronii]MDR7151856.1 peptide/nickel transport system ATP-binding protein [Hydrogenophaga palleronii]
MGSLVVVDKLTIRAGDATLVDALSFTIRPGEVLALIGESGSGKTTTALALMGHARRGCHISSGSVRIGDTDVLSLGAGPLRALRGRTVSYIAQSAAASFDPSRNIMDQVVEPTRIHGTMTRAQAEAKAVQLFKELALPDPETIGQRYPHQVSGGQLQRLMAAMALITDPELVILDEPTTALDVTTQIEVLRAFRRVVRERRATAVYVSHDLAVVAQMADHILVLRNGQAQEVNTTERILSHPAHEYTQSLLAAARPAPLASDLKKGELLLEVNALSAGYGALNAQGKPSSLILEDINFKLHKGQAIGVIGESGSGKTTLARAIAGLIAPCQGSILFKGRPLKPEVRQRSKEELRQIQIVFQMADTALNPSQTIERILARPLQFYKGLKGPALQKRIHELLDLVRLPHSVAQRLPGGLSGGQKQRVNLARALAAEPDLILCDEVTSALDTVVGAAVLELIADLRRELGVSYLFISHDLHTVKSVCDEIIVMQHGRKLDQVARPDFERGPHHPYYELLAASVPEMRQGWLDERDAAMPAAAALAT